MARVISIVGRYSGVVSYGDGSSGSWHCQMETDDIADLYWSVDAAASRVQTANIDVANGSEWSNSWRDIISTLPFITTFGWGSTPVTQTRPTDVVHHLSLLMSLDDGTEYPVSITYERGLQVDHLGAADLLSAADNAAAIIAKLQVMLALVSDAGQPVMT